MSHIKLTIADDHALFRNGLCSLLEKYEDIQVLGAVADGNELIQTFREGHIPDIVLLDLSMPGMNGFEVLKVLKKKYPTVRCIAISMYDDGTYITRCVRAGAYGYLIKNADESELIHAIRQVEKGHKYYNQEISEKMIHVMATEGDVKKLSKKEAEILDLLAEGKTTKEIAVQLFISTRTVETHRANMLKKLNVKNVAELVNKARTLNLISSESK